MKQKSIYTAVIISIAGAFFVPTVALSSCGMNYPDAWESGGKDGRFDAENNKGNAPGNHRPETYERAQNGDKVAKCYRAGYKNGFDNAYADLKRHTKKRHSSHHGTASFNCAKAQTKVEHAICDDKQLSTLDSEMGRLYKQIKAPDWKKIHKNLVKMRNKEAGKYSDPTNYLIKWTKDQIKELKREISLGG